MAHLFLAAQGLIPPLSFSAVSSLPAPDDLLPENKARYDAEQSVRTLWNVEWLILKNVPKDAARRRAYMEAYENPAPFFVGLKRDYLSLLGHEAEALEKELACVEACVQRSTASGHS